MEDYIPETIANEIVFESQRIALEKGFGDLLSESFLREVSARGRQVHYQPFDVVYRRKERATSFFVILDGAVQVGSTQMESGSCFGLKELLEQDSKLRGTSAAAMTQCTLLTINKESLTEIFADFPA